MDEQEPDRFLTLKSAQEVEILLEGLEKVSRNVLVDSLKRRLQVTLRYFKEQHGYAELKAAADKRNVQRRQDGRG